MQITHTVRTDSQTSGGLPSPTNTERKIVNITKIEKRDGRYIIVCSRFSASENPFLRHVLLSLLLFHSRFCFFFGAFHFFFLLFAVETEIPQIDGKNRQKKKSIVFSCYSAARIYIIFKCRSIVILSVYKPVIWYYSVECLA